MASDAVRQQASAPLDVRERPRLGPTLRGRDAEGQVFAGDGEAEAVIAEVADYCRRFCPVQFACVEERCRLWREEQRAAAFLGLKAPGPAEEVGVVGTPVTAF